MTLLIRNGGTKDMWQLLLKDNGAKQLFKDAVGPNEGRFDCSKK